MVQKNLDASLKLQAATQILYFTQWAACIVNRYRECVAKTKWLFVISSNSVRFWGFSDKLIHTSQISSVTILVNVLKLLINASLWKLEENRTTGRNNDITFLFMKMHLAIQSSNILNLGDFWKPKYYYCILN